MINLKEACRYAKFLNDTINKITADVCYGNMDGKILEIKDNHYKSKSNKDAEDILEEVVELDAVYDVEIEKIVELLEALITEKAILSNKIAKAKEELYIEYEENGEKLNIDTAIEMNKLLRQKLSDNVLNTLIKQKEKTEKRVGSDYMINVEGNQVAYKYEVERKTTLKYEKTDIVELNKKLLTKADKISEMIDEANSQRIIDIEPKFSIHDTVDELVLSFKE